MKKKLGKIHRFYMACVELVVYEKVAKKDFINLQKIEEQKKKDIT